MKKNLKSKEIKLKMVGFGSDFNPDDFFFIRLLRQKYNIVFSENPDYIFYTLGSNEHHQYDCVRIFYTGENVIPNFNYCDYAISFQHLTFEDRYLRCPLWRLYENDLKAAMTRARGEKDDDLLNRDFCACVISNFKQTDGKRIEAFDKLSAYKPLLSGGKWRNNVGGPVADKRAFQHGCKFSMCFENTYAPGYTTEKLVQGFAAGTVPVYYGDPDVTRDFNSDAFVNVHDFKNIDEVVHYVKWLDANPARYLKMLRAPIFKNGKLPARFSEKNLLAFFDPIFKGTPEQARRRFYAKPYVDIDYNNIKMRDVKGILKHVVAHGVEKIFSKSAK